MADRRFDFARDLQLKGDLVAAADLLLQATDLAPAFASAWFTLGEIRQQLGEPDAAGCGVREARAADADDRHGAGLRLMRMGAAPLAGMPQAYVKILFDQYASRFEASLVGDLGYRGPALLFKAVLSVCAAARRPAYFRRAIDLGCGTGLAAFAFAKQVDHFIGIDLSPRMIERSRATGIYAELEVADMPAGPAPPARHKRRTDSRRRRDGLRRRTRAVAERGPRACWRPAACSPSPPKLTRAKASRSAMGCAMPMRPLTCARRGSRRAGTVAAGRSFRPQ